MYLFSDTDERLISPGMGEEARHRGNVYCNLKTIGRVYSTAMACPPCCPGSHLGIVLTTRIASASSNGDMLRNTFILDMLPSLPTIICRMTLPCSLFFLCNSRIFDVSGKILHQTGYSSGEFRHYFRYFECCT